MILFRSCRVAGRYVHLHIIHPVSYNGSIICNSYHRHMILPSFQQTDLLKYSRRKSSTFENSAMGNTKLSDNKTSLPNDIVKSDAISRYDVEKLIEIYENNDEPLDTQTIVTLLKCCGKCLASVEPNDRQKLAIRVLALINRKNCEITIEHYNTFLKTSIENSQVIDSTKFLQYMVVEPDIKTYSLLMHEASKNGDSKSVLDIFIKMKDKFEPTIEMKLLLIEAYAKNGDIAQAFEIHKSMLDKELDVPKENYFWLAYGCVKANNPLYFTEMLSAEGKVLLSAEKLVALVNEWDDKSNVPDVMSLLQTTCDDGGNDDITNVLKCISECRIEEACKRIDSILLEVRDEHSMKSIVNPVLQELCKLSLPSEDIFRIVNRFAKLDIYKEILTDLARAALVDRQDLALRIFCEMKKNAVPVRPHYYWPLFVQAKEKGEKEIYSLLNCMASLNVEVDYNTLIDYVLPYVNTTDHPVVLTKLMNHGVQNSIAYSCLISYLLMHKQLEDVRKLFPNDLSPRLDFSMIINPLVKEYKRTGRMDICMYILQRRSLSGYNPKREFLIKLLEEDNCMVDFLKVVDFYKDNKETLSVHDVNTLIKAIDNLGLSETMKDAVQELSDNVEKEQRTYNTKQLERTLYKCEDKTINVRGYLRNLLMLYCKENKVDEALKIRDEFNSRKFKWTAGMKASLAELYVRNNMVNEASQVLSEILSEFPGFRLDSYKLVDFATCLTRNGEHKTAISIIDSNNDANYPPSIEVNCILLLNEIAKIQDFKQTKEMLHLLVKKRYIKLNNKSAGPLIKAHLFRNNLAAAVDTFDMCVKRYKVTPLKQELLIALVETLEDDFKSYESKLIYKVCDLINSTHGRDSALHSLLLALAKCKKVNRMRALLKSNTTINSPSILRHIAFFPPEDKSEILLMIIEESKNIHTIEKNSLSEYLLRIYDARNDPEAVIDLWKMLQRINVEPSEAFVTKAMNILVSNKFPIPAELDVQKYGITSTNNTNVADQ